MRIVRAEWLSHSGACYSVDAHPDGTRFATGGADGKVRLWSIRPVTHDGDVTPVAASLTGLSSSATTMATMLAGRGGGGGPCGGGGGGVGASPSGLRKGGHGQPALVSVASAAMAAAAARGLAAAAAASAAAQQEQQAQQLESDAGTGAGEGAVHRSLFGGGGVGGKNAASDAGGGSSPAAAALVAGDRVEARFGGGDGWFPGTVVAVMVGGISGSGDGASYSISYDGGDKEDKVAASLVRLLGSATAGQQAPPAEARAAAATSLVDFSNTNYTNAGPLRLASLSGHGGGVNVVRW